jgi:hypothetical protein
MASNVKVPPSSRQLTRYREAGKTTAANRLSQVREFYTFSNGGEVVRFLEDHPECVTVLEEAIPYLEQYFGKVSQVVLEVVSDPDMENAIQLIANIQTALTAEAAVERLRELDKAWFLGQLDRVGGIFNFNLDFV